MDCNILILNYIRYNVHHSLKVNIPGLSSFRVLPGTWGGLPSPFICIPRPLLL
jgi:hypothetical protein